MGLDDDIDVGRGPSLLFGLGGPITAGVAPILIPHKNKARFVILTNESSRQDAYLTTPYQVLEQAFHHYTVYEPVVLRRDYYEHSMVTHTRAYDVVHPPR